MWTYDETTQRWIGRYDDAEVRVAEVAPRVWVAWLSDADGGADRRCLAGSDETAIGALDDLANEAEGMMWDSPDILRVVALVRAWRREVGPR